MSRIKTDQNWNGDHNRNLMMTLGLLTLTFSITMSQTLFQFILADATDMKNGMNETFQPILRSDSS